jgi:hypothetical protein
MSVEDLMTQPVTLRTPAGETRGSAGSSETTYTTTTTTMYLEPTDGFDIRTNRDTPIGDWRGYGRAGVDFTAWQQIVYDGRVLDIVAPPRLLTNPRLQIPSHWEINLQEVQ